MVTGGTRSGKSAFAERLAASRRGPVIYVATAQPLDAEMEDRIARHRTRRPATWITREAPYDLLAALADLGQPAVVLIDCLSLWVSNRLLALGAADTDRWRNQVAVLEGTLCQEVALLTGQARQAAWDLILVTNEVGDGVVPPSPLGRAFRDLLGSVNAVAGAEAQSVFLVVAGVAVDLRALAARPEEWR